MKLTKKRGGIIAAAVLAVGVTAAGTSTAFADSSSGNAKSTASAHSAKAKAEAKRDARAIRARFLHGEHGEATVQGKDGAFVTREWQVGKVSAVNGQTVTVVSGDGASWTWTAGTNTKVRTDGKKADLGSVKAGDEVLVEGVKSGAANDARVLLDPGQAKIQKWETAAKNAQAKHAAKKSAPSAGTGS